MTDLVELWWHDLRSASLMGTARRDISTLPSLGVTFRDGPREQRLLDSAAIGDAVRRAGRIAVAPSSEPPPASPVEDLPAAEGASVQLLALLLHQPPVSATHRFELLDHWLRSAASVGRRVPHSLLPALLDLATQQEALRLAVPDAVGRRGHWLASFNPAWSWLAGAVDDAPSESDDWARLPGPERLARLIQLRSTDPASGRALALSTWDTDAANDRAAHVSAFRAGLTAEDEEFLESCLDDRSKNVREQATRLLDALPASARGQRMASRLRPLISVSGTLRRTIDVTLPDDPGPDGVRDGLIDPGRGRSKRAWWLQRIVVGAPLSVWSDATSSDPSRTVAMLRGAEAETVLPALREAARLQGDVDWSRALLATRLDTALLGVLPQAEQEEHMTRHLRHTRITEAAAQLAQLPRPWGPDLSGVVLDRLRKDPDMAHAVRVLRDPLVSSLHPSCMPRVESWLRSLGSDGDRVVRTTLRDALQLQSLRTSISEAFR